MRRGYRNGYRHRSLLTELGLVQHLRVPRDREASYRSTVVARYQRRQEKVNELVRECFLAGVSTRRVGEVLAPVLGEAPSPQQSPGWPAASDKDALSGLQGCDGGLTAAWHEPIIIDKSDHG